MQYQGSNFGAEFLIFAPSGPAPLRSLRIVATTYLEVTVELPVMHEHVVVKAKLDLGPRFGINDATNVFLGSTAMTRPFAGITPLRGRAASASSMCKLSSGWSCGRRQYRGAPPQYSEANVLSKPARSAILRELRDQQVKDHHFFRSLQLQQCRDDQYIAEFQFPDLDKNLPAPLLQQVH